jgi:hypothetical protein
MVPLLSVSTAANQERNSATVCSLRNAEGCRARNSSKSRRPSPFTSTSAKRMASRVVRCAACAAVVLVPWDMDLSRILGVALSVR